MHQQVQDSPFDCTIITSICLQHGYHEMTRSCHVSSNIIVIFNYVSEQEPTFSDKIAIVVIYLALFDICFGYIKLDFATILLLN